MKLNVRSIVSAAVLFLMVLAFTGAWVLAQELTAKEDAPSKFYTGKGSRSLEGAWTVTVTLRNCQTGAAIRTFPRTNMFIQGGTMQEFAAAVAPSLRGPGQGVWSFLYDSNFTYAIHFLRFNTDGTFGGSVTERRSVELGPDGETYNATGTGTIYDVSGNIVATNCATEEGVRFE